MLQDDFATLNVSELSAADQRVLARIFQHPLSHNLSWREMLALIASLGSVSHARDGDVVLRVGRIESRFRPTHDKDLSAEAVMALRHFLTRAGWGEAGVARAVGPAARDTVVVIDHSGARVFFATESDDATPQELHHLLHDTDRSQHDADRSETYPADTRFFDEVATALSGEGRIVVIGHGKGQSNEAGHLLAYLAKHHPTVHARVADDLVADLAQSTVLQLLSLARHALQAERGSAGPPKG
ncbi:MAG: hypothetical protein ACK47C_15130 [Paracoccaceae bacterium]|jgi:hypothetical protein